MQDLKIQKISVTRQGQRIYFQVKLPRQAARLRGIESGASFSKETALTTVNRDYRLAIRRSRIIGELQLQTNDTANFFYRDEIVQEDLNDFFTPMNPNEWKSGRALWSPKTFSAGRMKKVDEILIEEEKVIYGCYRDVVGLNEETNIEYSVYLYVWFDYKD